MDGNSVALVDPWGASTDGGEKGGAQKHADNYKTETGRSYSTDPSDGYVFDGVDVTPPAALANTPANTSFVPMSTMVFNTFELQQDVMRFGDLTKPKAGGENGFDINGYILIDKNGRGDSSNNFGSDGTSDGVIDVSGIRDIFGGHSQVLSKLLSFLHSIFGVAQESGVLEESEPAVNVVGKGDGGSKPVVKSSSSDQIESGAVQPKDSKQVPPTSTGVQEQDSKYMTLHLNVDSSSIAPFQVESNSQNRQLQQSDGFKWKNQVTGKIKESL